MGVPVYSIWHCVNFAFDSVQHKLDVSGLLLHSFFFNFQVVIFLPVFSIRSDQESHAISVVEWYVHDNGIFTTSSKDKFVRVWDANELCVVEKFKFSAPVYTHSMATSESHCLIAGQLKQLIHNVHVQCKWKFGLAKDYSVWPHQLWYV